MKNLLVLSGHGQYATGLASNVAFIAGEHEDLMVVDFQLEDTEDTLKQKYESIIEAHPESSVVFVCDLVGGTPFRCATGISRTNPNIEVVCGVNTAAIMESLFMKDTFSAPELAQFLIEKTHESCVHVRLPQKSRTMVEVDGI